MAPVLRALRGASLAAVLVWSETVGCSASAAGRFQALRGEGRGRTVASQAVQSSLQAALEAMGHGGEGAMAERVAKIEASMWPTFMALPKNPSGRLAPRAVRHLVHSYFAKEHGWLIKGLSHHGMQLNMTDVHEVQVLQDKAPDLVEKILEAQQSGLGLSLSDVVAMAVALERLIFDESMVVLEASYALNRRSASDKLDAKNLHGVLTSYLLAYEMGSKCNLSDVGAHEKVKIQAISEGGSWTDLVEFEEDAVLNFGYAHRHETNPFVPVQYSFQAAARIMEDLARDYGKWQNAECRHMRGSLMALDPAGTGRVPLSIFYSQSNTADYQFTESVEYLRDIGALEEATGGGAAVRIANYMAGPSNCIASSSYYSVCCLSDCDRLMNELEGSIQAPAAAPERLLGLAGNLSERELAEPLQAKLRAVAERHGGAVPLHGRLFAQWMHFAFPSECPYPHITEDVAVLTPGHWKGRPSTEPEEERERHIQAAQEE
eukprot:CAMPEP_0168441508 /NCGR_PEP_ID=MMETSP0228-20121227/43527_1 /TAXON_ID=133427 /ORGANISM="Protoceratium reticulatum, Strain CCCM 535 (=CCMP 1889)" /LENGTH=489 /DNA_ID=CAMNT_0008455837 /DNA_START=54 /DNA_END=1520 /DNA_ORIENTATION=-